MGRDSHCTASRRINRAVCEALENRVLLSNPIVLDPLPRDQRDNYIAPTAGSGNLSNVPNGHFEWEYDQHRLVYRLDQPVLGLDNQTHVLTALYKSILVENGPAYPLEDVPVTIGIGFWGMTQHALTLDSADNGATWTGSDGSVTITLDTDPVYTSYHRLRADTASGSATWVLSWNGYEQDLDSVWMMSSSGDGEDYRLLGLGSPQFRRSHSAGDVIAPPAISAPVFSADGKTATFTFGNEPLPDGNYEAILASAGITDTAGTDKLDGNTLVAGEQDFVYSFFARGGDANHDRVVNIDDFGVIDANRYRPGATGFFNGDFNYDGVIDSLDYEIINRTYGTVLPLPPTTPGQATVRVDGDAITLEWIQPAGTTHLGIWRSSDSGASFSFIDRVQGSSWTDSNLPDGSKFVYRTRAWSETAGYSHTTEKVSGVTTLPRPQALPSTGFSDGGMTLNWIDQSENETEFEIWTTADGTSWTLLDTVPGGAGSGTEMSYRAGGWDGLSWRELRVNARNSAIESAPTDAESQTIRSGGETVYEYSDRTFVGRDREEGLGSAAQITPAPMVWNEVEQQWNYRRFGDESVSLQFDAKRHTSLRIGIILGAQWPENSGLKTFRVKVSGKTILTDTYDPSGGPGTQIVAPPVIVGGANGSAPGLIGQMGVSLDYVPHRDSAISITIEAEGFGSDGSDPTNSWTFGAIVVQAHIPYVYAYAVDAFEGLSDGLIGISRDRNEQFKVNGTIILRDLDGYQAAVGGQDYKLEWQDRFPDGPNNVNAPMEMPIRVIGQPYDNVVPEDPEHVTFHIKPGIGYAVEPWGRYATAWIYDNDGGPQPDGLPTWTWPEPTPPEPEPPVDPPPPPEEIEDEIDIAVSEGTEGLMNPDASGTSGGGDGETTGWIIPVNDDRDEENTASTATEPVEPRLDNEENAGLGDKGHRITGGDDELRHIRVSIGSNDASRTGTWSLTWNSQSAPGSPPKIKVWESSGNGDYVELKSGDQGAAFAGFSKQLIIEGMSPSEALDDVSLVSTFTPTGGTGISDTIKLTLVKADLGFNNASDKPGLLQPTTPDTEFTIDAADDRYEEFERGLVWWWNKSSGDTSTLSAADLEDLIPFKIDLPQWIRDAGFVVSLQMDYVGQDGVSVWLYQSEGSSSDRTKFLSDPVAAVAQVTASQGISSAFRLTRSHSQALLTLLPLQSGSNELLMRISGEGVANINFTLLLQKSNGGGSVTEIAVDRAIVTVEEPDRLYTTVSARGTQEAPVSNPTLPFLYHLEHGLTQPVLVYPYEVIRDRHDPDVKSTLVYLHGYNVTHARAESSFSKTFKRFYWQGFRGNFVGFSWHGDEDLFAFDPNVKNALQTSPALWMFLRNTLMNDVERGGWGLASEDIDIAAHSLGNLVMWDALRLQSRIAPTEKLVRNVTSIEAAIWSEAFDPAGSVSYSGDFPIQYSATELEGMSWHHWFNAGDVNVRDAIAGKVFNSYHTGDEVLALLMRENEMVMRGLSGEHYSRSIVGLRTSINLSEMPALLLAGSRKPTYGVNDLSLPAGMVPIPIADRNIDAGEYGWDSTTGSTWAHGHSDHEAKPFPDVFPWWRYVFGGNGDANWAAVRIGRQ